MGRKSKATKRIVDEAQTLAERLGGWIETLGDKASGQLESPMAALEEGSREMIADTKAWLAELPKKAAGLLPVPVVVRRKRYALLGIVIGAAAAYLFDPAQGAARRQGVARKVKRMFGGAQGSTASAAY